MSCPSSSISCSSNRLVKNKVTVDIQKEAKCMDFSQKMLRFFPSKAANIPSLRALIISSNQIERLPVKLFSYSSLTELSMAWNRLTELADSIAHLKNLRKLDLAFNNLKHISPRIANLKSLRTLILNDNSLVTLPSTIGGLSKLTTLNVQYNQLTSLPRSLSECSKLTDMVVSGNPFVDPPMAVILNGCESILQYLREKPGLVSHRSRKTRFSLCKGSTVSKRHEQISRSEAGRPSPSVKPSVLVVGSSTHSRAPKWTGASERA
eukprot:185379_1